MSETSVGACPTRHDFTMRLRAVDDYDARGLLPAPVDFAKSFGKIGKSTPAMPSCR